MQINRHFPGIQWNGEKQIESVCVLLSLFLALSLAAPGHAQVTFGGTQISLASETWAAPTGVAADSHGNLFVSDQGHNRVLELPASGSGFGAPVTILSGLSGPMGVAADWSGNVFVSDTGNSRIVMLPITKSGYGSPVTVASGLNGPAGVAVDSADNLFVAIPGSNWVIEIPFSRGIYAAPFVVGTGFSNPMGVAVDASGSLYIADTGNKRVIKEPFTAGGYSTQTVIVKNSIAAVGISVDKSFDLFLADSANGTLVELPWQAGPNRYSGQFVIGSGFQSPTGVVTDLSGNVYVADSTNDQVMQLETGAVPFGAVSVGSSGSSLAYNFSIAAGTSIGAVNIYTQGVSGRDFVDAGQSTCALQTYAAATVCHVNVNFKPLAAGTRMGAVVLSDPSGNFLASAFTSGLGEDAQAAFIPGTATTLDAQLSGPEGVAVDGSGNVYVADTGNNRVVELAWTGSNYSQQTTVPITGLNSPMGVAVDGAGNLYVVSNGNDKVVRLAWTGTGYGLQTKVGDGLSGPSCVTVDAAGNVYITDTQTQRVYRIPWNGNGFTAEQPIGSYHKAPVGIAVDAMGNVYFSDPYQNFVADSPLTGDTYQIQFSLTQIETTFPTALAVDGNSNLYILDSARNQVVMLPRIGSGFGPQITVATGFNAPSGLAIDSNETLYVADTGNNRVVKIALSVPAVQTFANTTIGSTSQDSGHVARVENVGNQDLALASVSFPKDFPEGPGAVNACSNGASLGPGQSCELAINFTPQSAGSPLSESVSITDNSLGSSGAQQSVTVTGTSLARAAQTIEFSALPSVSYGAAPIVLAAKASSGLPVAFTVLSGPGTISSGDRLNINGAGTVVVQATQAGNTAYGSAPAVEVSIPVAPAILTVTPVNVTSVYGSIPKSFSYTITGLVRNDTRLSAAAGQPIVTCNATGNSGAGTYVMNATQGTLSSTNYKFAFVPGTLTITKAPIQVQAISVLRSYGSPMPALAWKLSGFLGGDNQSVVKGAPVLTTTANSGSPVGVYPIIASPGTLAAANYTFVAVNGSVTVRPAVLTVTATRLSTTYGSAIPALSYTVSGVMNGDTLSSVVEGAPVLSTTATSQSPPGSYPIQLSAGSLTAANYSFALVPGMLSINKATIVVTAANLSLVYGTHIPALTCSMIGFVNGDTAATAIQGSPYLWTTASTKSGPGIYPIDVSAGSMASKKYNFVFVNGRLTIEKP